MSAARDAAWLAAIRRVDRAYSLGDHRAMSNEQETTMKQWNQDKALRLWAKEEKDEGTFIVIGPYANQLVCHGKNHPVWFCDITGTDITVVASNLEELKARITLALKKRNEEADK